MRIGELARASGLTTSRIRFYEARGVIPGALRTGNGYRDYPVSTVAMLKFIDRAQTLGFTLAEVGVALEANDHTVPQGRGLLAGLRRKHGELGRHIREANARRRRIAHLIAELEACEPE